MWSWFKRYRPRHLDEGKPAEPQVGPATAYTSRSGAYIAPQNQIGNFTRPRPRPTPPLPGAHARNERR